jgi:GAF domain-containing protein
MGERATRLFLEANSLGGIAAKVRLASLARVTSAEAHAGPDEPALLERLRGAMVKVRQEFPASAAPHAVSRRLDTDGVAARLRLHLDTFLDLLTQRAVVLESVDEAARRVTEAAASALSVARASVWLLEASDPKIVCLDLFQADLRAHSSGIELFARDFAPYFEALLSERSILANDARHDPRTSCFAESYLAPLGIGAMLDVPVWVRGELVGVICCEHIGSARVWDADEERFGHLVSSFLSLALERRSPGTEAPR